MCRARKVGNKCLICLDVETQWNSNYLMLELAVKYQNTSNLLELQDNKYTDELIREKMKGLPLDDD